MPVGSDFYEIILRFPRLFPDPAAFEDQTRFVNRYLTENGLSKEKSTFICQTTEEITPVDDRGNPSVTSGTGKFPFEGRTIVAEYMTNANVRIGYADFGTGLSPGEHSRLWSRGKLGGLRFQLQEFKHQWQTLNIPDISELYGILKKSATPRTLSTLELDSLSDSVFKASTCYIEHTLRAEAEKDGMDVEVYGARDLSASEKIALEKRLTRQTNRDTVFVILGRKNGSISRSPVES